MPTVLVPPPAGSNCSCGASPPPAHTAVILETRASPALEFAVLHMACSLPEDWGLMLVMGGAAGLAMLAYKGFPRWFSRPLLGGQFLTQPASWNRQTVIGSAIFGVGWGLSGVCPGPAIAALGTGNTDILWALGGIVLGALAHGLTARD